MYDPGSTISSGHVTMPPEIFKHSDYNARAMKRAEGRKKQYEKRGAVVAHQMTNSEMVQEHLQAMKIRIAYKKHEKLPRIVQTQTNTQTNLRK